MSSNRAPTVEEAIRSHIAGALNDMHTMLPAVVTAYDAATQRVDVQPLVKRITYAPDGSKIVKSLGVQVNLPVHFMSAGGFVLTCPISDGSLVNTDLSPLPLPATRGMLLVSESSLDVWKTGTGQEVDPVFNERFQLKDGVFVPGLNPFGNPLPAPPQDQAFLGVPGGIGAHFQAKLITLGDLIGSKKIVLDGDSGSAGTLTAVLAGSPPAIAVTITYTPPGGVPTSWFAFTATAGTPGTYNLALSTKVTASSTQSKAH